MSPSASAETALSTPSVADWPGDKAAAFVIYSDDSMVRSIKSQWTPDHPEVPYDGFYTLGKSYGIPVTFFVVPRLMDDAARGDTSHVYYSSLQPPAITAGAGSAWADWRFMHEQGHEIASHSYSHTDFRPGLEGRPRSDADPRFELEKAVASIEQNIGERPVSMNFAYGTPTEPILALARHYTPLTEEDFSSDTDNVRKAVYGSDTRTEDLVREMEAALAVGQCLILGGHGIRTELGRKEEAAPGFRENGPRWDGYKPIEYTELEGFFQYLDANRERIYIDVFKNVSRTLIQRKAARLTVLEQSAGETVLRLTDGLDNGLYDRPLTLKIPVLESVKGIRVTQDGVAVPLERKGPIYLAQVVPDAGLIRIRTER